MHRFTDPADGETYVYTQHDPDDSSGSSPPSTSPTSRPSSTSPCARPRAGPSSPTASPSTPATAAGRPRTTPPISTYLVAVAAGPYHSVRTYEHPRPAFRHPLPSPLAPHLDADATTPRGHPGLSTATTSTSTTPTPSTVRPGVRPRVQPRCHGEPRTGHLPRRVRLPVRRHRHPAAEPRHGHRPRDGPHVVRRPRHPALVGRPLAERVLRRLHGLPATADATRFTDTWTDFADRRKAWAYRADQRPSTHPDPGDVEDTASAQLNFDGITYAKGASALQPARRVRRAGRVPGRRAALLQAARVRQHRASATCCPSSR
ncbi:Aminopeptidase N OS=Streptomyces tendae OX=1932 GN=pepN PE=3 SV=1 [Streptomyces tendae]